MKRLAQKLKTVAQRVQLRESTSFMVSQCKTLGHEMKKHLLFASVAVVALIGSGPVQAADLGQKPIYKAPPPAPTFSWRGCYVGGHLGGGWGTKRFSDEPGSFLAGGVVNDDVSGILGGGQIGCDFQVAPNWVLGIEGAASAADINGRVISPFNGKSLSAKTDWLASVTGRVGYSFDRWMLYTKGGVAWAGDKFSVTEAGVAPNTYSLSQTRTGWTIGVGTEWAFSGNWSAKLEYNFYDFGSSTNMFACSNANPVICGQTGGPTRGPETVRQEINQVKVGINYRFY